MAIITIATKKLLKLKKRIRAVCGGTSASKTYSIIMILIDYAGSNKKKKIDIMSESYPHLEDGAIKDFKEIMMNRGYWRDSNWNETKHIYKFETRSIIKFISVDKIGKSRGPRRDVLFMNEAPNIRFDIYEQLEVRTKEIIWLDWNPTHEFWYDTEIKDKVDHDFLRLTYLDCINALDQRIIDSIESRRGRKDWWQVYGLGLLGEITGKIFNDWKIIDEVPHEAKLQRYGLNFGYTNHPAALVAIYHYNGGYILDEIMYGKGVSNQNIADILKNEDKALVVADCAEPKSIDEIRSYQINIIGCKKKVENTLGSMNVGSEGSYVKWSIGIVQGERISITKRSVNVIKEYRNYLWQVDKDGRVLNVPEEPFHYSMDAVRYGVCSLAPIINKQEFMNNIPRLSRGPKPMPGR